MKTFSKAIELYYTHEAQTTYIYMAEGQYEPFKHDGDYQPVYINGRDSTNDGLTRSLYVFGGYPTPGAYTDPQDTCQYSHSSYITEFVPSKAVTESLFELYGAGARLEFRGVNLRSTLYYGKAYRGSFATIWGTFSRVSHAEARKQFSDQAMVMKDCIIDGYQSGAAGFIFQYAGNKTKIHFSNLEVKSSVARIAGGGGFFSQSQAPLAHNTQLEMRYCSFRNIQRTGASTGNCIIGMINKCDAGEQATASESYAHISNVTVSGVKASNVSGMWAPMFFGNIADVKIEKSIFRNIRAGVSGAVMAYRCLRFESRENLYENCVSGYHGGAVHIETKDDNLNTQSSATVDDLKVAWDRKANFFFIDDEYKNNLFGEKGQSAGEGGAAISVNHTLESGRFPYDTVMIYGCKFQDNKTGVLNGGAVAINCNADNKIIMKSRFCHNEAGVYNTNNFTHGGGGAIYNQWIGKLLVDSCLFEDNSASAAGGAVYHKGNTSLLDIKRCKFVKNEVKNFASEANYGGGAIFITNKAYAKVKNCYFENNSSGPRGGAIAIKQNENNTNTIVRCTFKSNKTGLYGGAIGVKNQVL